MRGGALVLPRSLLLEHAARCFLQHTISSIESASSQSRLPTLSHFALLPHAPPNAFADLLTRLVLHSCALP